MQVLDDHQATVVRSLCELLVPGSARVWPEVYVDALLARMPDDERAATLAAIAALEPAAGGDCDALAQHAFTPEFMLAPRARLRGVLQRLRRARRSRSGRLVGDRLRAAAGCPARQGLVLPRGRGVSERYEIVVVGSGAGGGVVAAELAEAGRSVLLLECGPHRSAADHMRWEARATHELWWPLGVRGAAGPRPAAAGDVPRPLRRRHDDDQHQGGAAPGASRTTRSGTPRPGSSTTAASRSASRTCCPTSSASSNGSAFASAATGSSA